MTEPRERPAGTLVKGKWRVTDVLRSGTAAAVYLAKSRAGSNVALKIVHAHLATDELVRRRILEEAEVLASLDHPAIVRVLDEDVADDGATLLLLEPLDGETLDRRAARLGGALALEDVFDVADLLLEFLRAAHARGVLHFDITPANLFLTDTGLLKILDFGALEAPSPSGARTGAPTGRAFTAPELLLDEASDARSDIWAVGALMHSLVTGAPPRAHDAPAHSVASVPVRVLRDSPLELPRAFVNIVDRALEFDRADRWPDVEAMQQALRWARRSLESGWGGGEPTDPLVPRPSRSSLAEQARLARLSATPAPSVAAPATGPTPVEVTVLARLRDDAVRSFNQTGADVATPRPELEEQTLVGERSVPAIEALRRDEDFRLRPRRASEPTLPSASIVPDSEKTKTSNVRPAGGAPATRPPLDSLVTETPSPAPALASDAAAASLGEIEEPTGEVAAVTAGSLPPPNAPPRRPSLHPPSNPPGSDGEHANDPDTLIRTAPRVSLPAADEIVAPARTVVHAADDTRVSPPPISEPRSDPMPPTVRLDRRVDSPIRRVLILAAAAGALVGALAFGFWPRTPPPLPTSRVSSVDAAALAALAPSSSSPPIALAVAVTDAALVETDGGADAASVEDAASAVAIAAADAALEEEDAAAAVEARLAEARRRRRERAAAEAAQTVKEAGPTEGDNPYGEAPVAAASASAAPSTAPALGASATASSAPPAPSESEAPTPKPRAAADAGESP